MSEDNYYPSTRKEAKERGFKYYFTGEPCKNGHVDFRYTSCGRCYTCKNEQSKKWQRENRGHTTSYQKQWRYENKESVKEYGKRSRENNAGYEKQRKRKWHENNRDKARAAKAKRRAAKINAIPKWVDEDVLQMIEACRPEGYHIDHIIPLQHELVCGLHVPENMQYLTPEENYSKHANFDPAEPDKYFYAERYCLDFIKSPYNE